MSFVAAGIHPSDIGTLLDQMGIAVRTGHHCTQPLMERFGISGTVRAGFGIYNTKEEVDFFLDGIRKAMKMLQ
jgi:cysteine desulfurase/selenocysteine lyase